jgi:hypothetical protein
MKTIFCLLGVASALRLPVAVPRTPSAAMLVPTDDLANMYRGRWQGEPTSAAAAPTEKAPSAVVEEWAAVEEEACLVVDEGDDAQLCGPLSFDSTDEMVRRADLLPLPQRSPTDADSVLAHRRRASALTTSGSANEPTNMRAELPSSVSGLICVCVCLRCCTRLGDMTHASGACREPATRRRVGTHEYRVLSPSVCARGVSGPASWHVRVVLHDACEL